MFEIAFSLLTSLLVFAFGTATTSSFSQVAAGNPLQGKTVDTLPAGKIKMLRISLTAEDWGNPGPAGTGAYLNGVTINRNGTIMEFGSGFLGDLNTLWRKSGDQFGEFSANRLSWFVSFSPFWLDTPGPNVLDVGIDENATIEVDWDSAEIKSTLNSGGASYSIEPVMEPLGAEFFVPRYTEIPYPRSSAGEKSIEGLNMENIAFLYPEGWEYSSIDSFSATKEVAGERLEVWDNAGGLDLETIFRKQLYGFSLTQNPDGPFLPIVPSGNPALIAGSGVDADLDVRSANNDGKVYAAHLEEGKRGSVNDFQTLMRQRSALSL